MTARRAATAGFLTLAVATAFLVRWALQPRLPWDVGPKAPLGDLVEIDSHLTDGMFRPGNSVKRAPLPGLGRAARYLEYEHFPNMEGATNRPGEPARFVIAVDAYDRPVAVAIQYPRAGGSAGARVLASAYAALAERGTSDVPAGTLSLTRTRDGLTETVIVARK